MARDWVNWRAPFTPIDPQRRLPVWIALSELFLDTELQRTDFERLAAALSSTHYSVDEIEAILRREVYPVCIANLQCLAGEWAGFDADWLCERIVQRERRWLRVPQFCPSWWMVADDWTTLRAQLAARRSAAVSRSSCNQ